MDNESLTQEQIVELYETNAIKNKDIFDRVVMSNKGLAGLIANRFLSTGIAFDDLFQVGCIGLIRAVATYDISKGAKLITYACKCIENEIKMFLDKERKHSVVLYADGYNYLNLDGQVEYLPLEELTYTPIDEVTSNYDLMERIETLKKLYDVIATLDPRTQKILSMFFGLNCSKISTQQEIGKEININQSYVSKILSKTLDKLKKYKSVQEIHDTY